MVPPVSKQTLILLAELSSYNVLILIHKGFVKQVDGLQWLAHQLPFAKFNNIIEAHAKLYIHYMDYSIQNM